MSGITRIKQVIILILSRCFHSTLCTHLRGRGGTFKIISSRAKRENSFTRTYQQPDFSTIDSRTYFPYFLYFIRSMKLYPPPLFCQPFSFVFPRFFIFCRFCVSFLAVFAFLNKKLSTAPRLWITRFYFLFGCFIRTDYFSSGCFSITSVTSVNSVGGVIISSRTFLIREEMSCILRARLSE